MLKNSCPDARVVHCLHPGTAAPVGAVSGRLTAEHQTYL